MLSYIMTHNATPSDFNNYHVRQNAMMEKMKFILLMFHFVMTACRTMAQCDSQPDSIALPSAELYECEHAASHDSIPQASVPGVTKTSRKQVTSIYELPYSVTGRSKDWHHLWINTATLNGAFVSTLLVLQCLPEDATAWNRTELQNVPLARRWYRHVIKKGPEWDHDKFYFNYILHPYAGAVYFMAARSCGFNAWESLLYCSLISNIGWEFGIEAFMERPSYQDMLITPLVGSLIGEWFYKTKRAIVNNGYRLHGSSALGNIVAFLIDPVNEVMGLFTGNPGREIVKRKASDPSIASTFIIPNNTLHFGMSLCITF